MNHRPRQAGQRAVVLLSGGVESSVLLREALNWGPVLPLFVACGQRALAAERRAARRQCAVLGLELKALGLTGTGRLFRDLRGGRAHVPLPQRNLLLLALGLSLAQHQGASRVLLAVNRDDAGHHPGADPAFLAACQALAGASAPEVAVDAPLAALTKAEVVRRGEHLGVDWRATWSCLLAGPQPCGGCPQCRSRATAFSAAGVTDPALLAA